MTPEQVIARVLGVAASEVNDATSNKTLAAWDSLAHMNLVLEIEAVYGVALSTEDAMTMTDVATIKRLLLEHGATW